MGLSGFAGVTLTFSSSVYGSKTRTTTPEPSPPLSRIWSPGHLCMSYITRSLGFLAYLIPSQLGWEKHLKISRGELKQLLASVLLVHRKVWEGPTDASPENN